MTTKEKTHGPSDTRQSAQLARQGDQVRSRRQAGVGRKVLQQGARTGKRSLQFLTPLPCEIHPPCFVRKSRGAFPSLPRPDTLIVWQAQAEPVWQARPRGSSLWRRPGANSSASRRTTLAGRSLASSFYTKSVEHPSCGAPDGFEILGPRALHSLAKAPRSKCPVPHGLCLHVGPRFEVQRNGDGHETFRFIGGELRKNV